MTKMLYVLIGILFLYLFCTLFSVIMRLTMIAIPLGLCALVPAVIASLVFTAVKIRRLCKEGILQKYTCISYEEGIFSHHLNQDVFTYMNQNYRKALLLFTGIACGAVMFIIMCKQGRLNDIAWNIFRHRHVLPFKLCVALVMPMPLYSIYAAYRLGNRLTQEQVIGRVKSVTRFLNRSVKNTELLQSLSPADPSIRSLIAGFILLNKNALFGDRSDRKRFACEFNRCVDIRIKELLSKRQTHDSNRAHENKTGDRRPRTNGNNGRMTEEQAYRVLGVTPGTPVEQIKKAYRSKVVAFHPDQFDQKHAEIKAYAQEQMKMVNAAFDYLKVCMDFS